MTLMVLITIYMYLVSNQFQRHQQVISRTWDCLDLKSPELELELELKPLELELELELKLIASSGIGIGNNGIGIELKNGIDPNPGQ